MFLMKKFLTELANYKLQQEKWWNTGKWYSNKNSERKFRGTCWYFHENINFCIENLIFPSDLKVADVRQLSKRNQRLQKITAEPLAFYLKDLKYIKYVFTTKFRITFMKSYININVDFAKDLMHNTA